MVPLRYTVHKVFNDAGNRYGASFTESYRRTNVVRGLFARRPKRAPNPSSCSELPDDAASARATRRGD